MRQAKQAMQVKVMSGEEVRTLRQRLGLTQAQLARLLLIKEPRTVRRWELGELPVNGPASVALQILMMLPEDKRRALIAAAKQKKTGRQALICLPTMV